MEEYTKDTERPNEGAPSVWSAEQSLRERLDRFQNTIENLFEGFQVIDRNWRYVYVNQAAARHGRSTADRMLNRTMMECYPGIESTEMFAVLEKCMNRRVRDHIENRFDYDDGTSGWFELLIDPIPEGVSILSVDVTDRKQAEDELKRRMRELEAVNRVSSALRTAHTVEEMLPVLLDETLKVMLTDRGAIWLYNSSRNELRVSITRGFGEGTDLPIPPAERGGEGIAGLTIMSGKPEVSVDVRLDERLPDTYREGVTGKFTALSVPIRAAEVIVGAFTVCAEHPRQFMSEETSLLVTVSDMAGNAIHRSRLHEETERRLRRIGALREIDLAITTSFDLKRNLKTVLEQVTQQLGADAADVLLFNKGTSLLEFAAGYGFKTGEIERSMIHLGEGAAGTVALERRTLHIPDLRAASGFTRSLLVEVERLAGYHCVPLLTRGAIRGVLEVFDREYRERNSEWLGFLVALAGQTAIAVDVSSLFDNLQHTATELSTAYDATIEGWSRALDLRDKETEGHTLRVTELTMRIAKASGFRDEEMANVRWGALLHDIGKLGVPDAVLLKEGPLSDEEWVSMRKHPVFAFEMLSPIPYLRNAIDIPYCHHEKWDGTGYPRGLKGGQIPLSARLFAVVDVWDALRSDRPYRKAWDEERVIEHIKGLSGSHFEPAAVSRFLQVVGGEKQENNE